MSDFHLEPAAQYGTVNIKDVEQNGVITEQVSLSSSGIDTTLYDIIYFEKIGGAPVPVFSTVGLEQPDPTVEPEVDTSSPEVDTSGFAKLGSAQIFAELNTFEKGAAGTDFQLFGPGVGTDYNSLRKVMIGINGDILPRLSALDFFRRFLSTSDVRESSVNLYYNTDRTRKDFGQNFEVNYVNERVFSGGTYAPGQPINASFFDSIVLGPATASNPHLVYLPIKSPQPLSDGGGVISFRYEGTSDSAAISFQDGVRINIGNAFTSTLVLQPGDEIKVSRAISLSSNDIVRDWRLVRKGNIYGVNSDPDSVHLSDNNIWTGTNNFNSGLNSLGKVGIGTVNPRAELDVREATINPTSTVGVAVFQGVDQYSQVLTLQAPVSNYGGSLTTSYKANGSGGQAILVGVKFENDIPQNFVVLSPSGTPLFTVDLNSAIWSSAINAKIHAILPVDTEPAAPATGSIMYYFSGGTWLKDSSGNTKQLL